MIEYWMEKDPRIPPLQMDVHRALSELDARLAELAIAIREEASLPAWVYKPLPGFAGREREHAAWAISLIDYEDGQGQHETRVFPGALAASAGTLALAKAVNCAKEQLAEAVKKTRGVLVRAAEAASEGDAVRLDLADYILRKLGRARLHKTQAYRRQLVLLDEPPVKASFIWANPRSVKRISIESARGMVTSALSDEDAKQALSVLDALPDDKLAKVKPPTLTPKCNLVFGEPGHWRRPPPQMAVLPILYPYDPDRPPPQILPLGEKSERSERLPRSDRKLEDTPLFEGLPIYRYREP